MAQRVRRSAEDARRMILEAAEKRFREGGQAAVRVQVVARDVGLTDAAVHHHFGSRKGLLEALLRHAGREVRDQVETAVLTWSEGSRDLASLNELFEDCYDRRGYAQLATWLRLSGTQGRGSGMLSALVDVLERDTELPRTELQFIVALFHLLQAANPLFGEAMLRSAGLKGDADSLEKFRSWLLGVFERLLQG
jgi:AcrR family transcriptional regulator